MNNAWAQPRSDTKPFWILVRFNFVKLGLFYSTHSSHRSHFFNVPFTFTLVFNLFCLLYEKGRVLQYFELCISSISCWNRLVNELNLTNFERLIYELNMKNVGEKKNVPKVKKLCRIQFIFSIWLILLVILFLHCLRRKQLRYWSLLFSWTLY